MALLSHLFFRLLAEFQQKWMSAETWVQLIVKYSIVDSSLMFNGEKLDKCINSRENKHLQDEMDLRLSIPKDHIGIFHEQQRKKGSTKRTSYYYATTSGKSPDKEKKWFDCITDAHELLNKKITRASETLLVVSPTQQLTKNRKLQASELAVSAEDKTIYDANLLHLSHHLLLMKRSHHVPIAPLTPLMTTLIPLKSLFCLQQTIMKIPRNQSMIKL